nr:glycosyl transferase GT4 family protein [Methanobrevibacter arboriphilus]
MKKVLLIAFYFNQTNAIASKRLRGIAKYLPQFGWEPIVIVPKSNINYGNSFENSFESSLKNSFKNSNFKVIETDYEYMTDRWFNKFKNKKNTKNDTKLKSKNEIEEVNENNINDQNKIISKNNPEETSKLASKTTSKAISKAISIAGEIFAYPDGMKYWYEPAIKVSKEAIEVNNIEAIISSSWPVTSHIIAKDLKKKYNLKWIADLRDLWNLNPYVKHTFIRNYFEKKLEIETLEYADVLTTTTELASKKLKELHPQKKICTIMSGYDIEDITNNNTPKNQEKLNFTYAGSLYGGKRDPKLLFKGISELIRENKINPLLLSLDFYGDNFGLKETAEKYGIEDLVNIHGTISHEEVLKKQKESQALLLLSWNNKKEEIFLPGKIYEYLAAKRPILSIGYKKGSLKDLIEKTEIGYHVSTLDETKNIITKFYNNFNESKILRYNGNSEVNKYSIISTAQKFGSILDSIK